MEVISIVTNIILVTIVATVFLAVGSYLAYKLREMRRPKVIEREKPVFFRKYQPKQAAGKKGPAEQVEKISSEPPTR